MIVTMRKVSLVLLQARKEKALRKLKKLGVVHVEGTNGTSDNTADIEELKGQAERALFSLGKPAKGVKPVAFTSVEDALKKGKEITDLLDWMTLLKDDNISLAKEMERVEPLGNLILQKFMALPKRGAPYGSITFPRKRPPHTPARTPSWFHGEKRE